MWMGIEKVRKRFSAKNKIRLKTKFPSKELLLLVVKTSIKR
jgi:hypothetical protein